MIIDIRTLPDGHAVQADLCILGGGPAAIWGTEGEVSGMTDTGCHDPVVAARSRVWNLPMTTVTPAGPAFF